MICSDGEDGGWENDTKCDMTRSYAWHDLIQMCVVMATHMCDIISLGGEVYFFFFENKRHALVICLIHMCDMTLFIFVTWFNGNMYVYIYMYYIYILYIYVIYTIYIYYIYMLHIS